MDGFKDFTIGTGDNHVGNKAKRFKGKEGETYRVSFVWVSTDANGNLSPRFTGADRHYLQGVGYFLHKGPEYAKLAGGPPKQAVATIICVWPTDKKGRLNAEQFKAGEGFQVMPWVFSPDKYEQIARRHEEWPLTDYDLTLACTDTQYQKMDLSPARENLFKKLADSDKPGAKAIADRILQEVANVEKNLRNDIARDLTLDQIREKLGGGGSTTGGPATTADNVEGLLDDLLDED